MTLFLDTETTGLSPARGDAIVEVAIVDSNGQAVLDTLVNPNRSIPWYATKVHGITDEMVRGRPTLSQLMPKIRQIISNKVVVIYNSSFDTPFFPGRLKESISVECAMRRFTEKTGGGQWKKLAAAAQTVGHRWTGTAHRAMADALACRSVWNWLEKSSTRNYQNVNPKNKTASDSAKTIFRCPNCSSLLRAPSGKLLEITCPKCHRSFLHQT